MGAAGKIVIAVLATSLVLSLGFGGVMVNVLSIKVSHIICKVVLNRTSISSGLAIIFTNSFICR